MGILNITPDSFYDGGRFFDKDRAIEHAFQLQEEGADIIDIGGQSTRPGSTQISAEEEIDRVIPVLMNLKGKLRIPVSIDTYYAKVARIALENGAELINDNSALTMDKEEMLKVVTDFNVPVVLMHYHKTLQPMQTEPEYKDVLYEIACWLKERAHVLTSNKIAAQRIILDPGIGFGKLLENNVEIFYKLDALRSLGFPILVGPSRKSFIGAINKELSPQDRLSGTIASCIVSLLKGAMIIRVHDVKKIKDALEVVSAILSGT
ncbi:MAG: dihydropteroate synthase [Candidatus Fischerbacteria bacterium RBG_13_37_8]|uniref:Dihydropteroate synthase n=1 Tax=Candidatus Fischerbacteria bacterium RBG_13_37_8 TaxID=1817863 RepID=A0A1F5V5L3_9BACT|nr:MAG: dihydropteroate synthase [Candidatus Fischerbacteria bacterium RBG_13_37_8]